MFLDRADAARQLAARLRDRRLHAPIVLGVPRGGVVGGAVLARELGADLDVVLSRKLRAPGQPELAIGAVCENGRVYLNRIGREVESCEPEYVAAEQARQVAEIARRRRLFRAVRPQAPLADRSVIVTDDGVATGSTLLAALQTIRERSPRELIVAVPVASPDRLPQIALWCDEVVCLAAPDDFYAIGQYYEDFTQVDDAEVVDLLREFAPNNEVESAS